MTDLDALAAVLQRAYATGTPVPPLTETHDGLTLDDAYAIADWRISLLDTVADNASSGGFVIGQALVPLDRVDLSPAGCVLRRNGRIVATGAGAAVLGSPLHAAAWLANELTGRGAELSAGQVILTGSITAAIPVQAGDAVTATFDHLGSVTTLFD